MFSNLCQACLVLKLVHKIKGMRLFVLFTSKGHTEYVHIYIGQGTVSLQIAMFEVHQHLPKGNVHCLSVKCYSLPRTEGMSLWTQHLKVHIVNVQTYKGQGVKELCSYRFLNSFVVILNSKLDNFLTPTRQLSELSSQHFKTNQKHSNQSISCSYFGRITLDSVI